MTAPSLSRRAHAGRILSLGLPLMGSQTAQFAIQLTDTVMLGRYDVTVLAGQVLASSLFVVLLLFGSGFGWAVMPLVAAAQGSGDARRIRRVTRMALWLSALFGVLAMPVFLVAGPLFGLMGQEAVPAALAGKYLAVQGWSIFPALGVMVLRSYLSGLGRANAVLWATLLSVAVNAVVNYALIFGNLGAPELGILGAALASVVSTLAGCAALAVYGVRVAPEQALLTRLWVPDWPAFGQVFRLGLPIGLTTVAEVALFSGSSVMMGWVGTVPLAAHGIALQITAVAFMLHIGLSQAATIRAGDALGRGDGPGLRRGAWVVLVLSGGLVLLTMVVFLAVPGWLMGLFLDAGDPAREEVLALGRVLLAAGALFQLVDAGQVMALGLLRGVQDTRVPMWLAMVSYWGLGMPAAYLLTFSLGVGPVGVWLGLATGLACAGLSMQWRFWRQGAYAVENGSVA